MQPADNGILTLILDPQRVGIWSLARLERKNSLSQRNTTNPALQRRVSIAQRAHETPTSLDFEINSNLDAMASETLGSALNSEDIRL